MKYLQNKTNDYEKLVRKLTRVIKQNTNYNDVNVIVMVDNMIDMLIIDDYDVNAKILHAFVYLYTTSELEKMKSNRFVMFFKKIFFYIKRWKRNPEVAQQRIVTRSQI
tara:strand:- start:160 stop:483 length:324 start_codon:yes stop_codon:yes gene_type:complete